MNLQKENKKKKVFFVLYWVFALVTVVVAVLTIADKVDSAGYAILSMLIALIFNALYRSIKKAIEENKE